MKEDIKVFDAHMHYTGKFKNKNESLIDFLDRFGIEKAVITTLNTAANSKLLLTLNGQLSDQELAEQFYPKTQYSHEKVKELVQSNPERLIGFYWFNPKVADAEDWKELTRFITSYGFKGVKTQASLDNLDPETDLDKLAEFCINHNIPLYFHSGTSFHFQKPVSLKSLHKFKKKHKKLELIIGHAAFTMEYMISLLRFFKDSPNVYFETSLSVPYGIKVLIKVMGEGRVLYGSDSPAATTPDIEINKIKILELSETVQKKVFYENIDKLLSE
jgi:predicted TIM-barrel fold metal-dependent hydrolase